MASTAFPSNGTLRPIDRWALENMPNFAHVIVLPSRSIKGRIGDANKPKAKISTGYLDMNDYYYSLLRITSDNEDDPFWIDVDMRGLINAEDKEHGSSIPADVFKGKVDGVHVPTGRFENPTEAGWTIRFDCEAVPSFWCAVDLAVEPVKINFYKEKLLGIERSMDDFKAKLSVAEGGWAAIVGGWPRR